MKELTTAEMLKEVINRKNNENKETDKDLKDKEKESVNILKDMFGFK